MPSNLQVRERDYRVPRGRVGGQNALIKLIRRLTMAVLEKWEASYRKYEDRLESFEESGVPVGTGEGGNECLHQDNRPENTSKLLVLVKGGVWVEGAREKGRPRLEQLEEEGDNEHSHRGNQTARRGYS